jgi:hypothetical protein
VAAASTVAIALSLLLLSFFSVGCESNGTANQNINLETYVNKLDVQFDTPMLQALAKGTILQVQTGKSAVLVRTKLSSFEVLSGSGKDARIPPGTEVVIEVISPKGDYSPGKGIEAFVRVVRSSTGLKLIADNSKTT